MKNKGYNVLHKPLTKKEIKTNMKDGYITGVVSIDMGDLIDNDLEWVLDSLSESLIGSVVLQDVDFDIVGFEGNTLHLKVTGDPSLQLEIE